MKPQLLKIPYGPDHSFGIRKEMEPNINNRWHYHPEIELIHFHNGYGTQFVGDHMKQFGPGDIVLVGSDLPHFWKFDDSCFNDEQISKPYSTVIHFFENFIGERFLHLPEARPLKTLLEKAKRGLLISGAPAEKAAALIEQTYQAEGLNKIISLITCLSELASMDQLITLSSISFKYDFPASENKRITSIYNYTLSHFHKKISLKEIADVAELSPNSFCRYFKYHTGKTYSGFLTEIRIGYACKLLLENKASIKQICYDCGFNNISCFYEYFKQTTGKTPQSYQKEYN